MSVSASQMTQARLNEVGARVNGRLQQISSMTGIQFPTLFAAAMGQTEATETEQTVEAVVETNTDASAVSADGYAGKPYADMISQLGELYGIDPALIHSVVVCESSYNPDLVSSAGAQGLMQLMPGTAEALGVTDVFDPWQNLDGGTRYLVGKLYEYEGDLKMALAAYNCGSGTLRKRQITDLNDPAQYAELPRETQNYIARVIARLTEYGKGDLADTSVFV